MSEVSKWTTYWRNTLADGERNEIDLSYLDKNKVLFLKSGQIDIESGNIDKSVTRKLFDFLNKKEDEEDNDALITKIPVLISPFSLIPTAESAIESEEKEMYPFWIKAVLDDEGNLVGVFTETPTPIKLNNL